MSPTLPLTAACLLGCLAAIPPAPARAQQVQRCMGADGRAVYTDRRCDDIGAVDRLPPAGATEGPRLFRGGCPRVLSQLVGEINAAVQGRDVNRLAGIYDWSGVSDASASRILDRLEAIVERPLVDIAPVYGETAERPAPAPEPAGTEAATASAPAQGGGPAAWMPSWAGAQQATAVTSDAESGAGDSPLPATPPARPRPVALRIEQTLAGSATPVRSVFGLRRSHGCFWITM